MKNTRKQLGIRLFNLALAWSNDRPETQRERNAAIKSMRARKSVINGSKSITAAREAVENAAAEIRSNRASRYPRPYLRGCYNPAAVLAVRLQSTLATRLHNMRIKKISEAFTQCLRHPTHGGVNFHLTASPDSVDVTVEHTLDWDLYRGSFKGRPANVYTIDVTVPEQWATRVLKTGLAIADSLLTLDAAPLDGAPEGIRLYAATWAQQARGYEIRVNHGIIATDGERFHHADTVKKALTGLRRKVEYVPPTAEQSIDRFCAKYGKESFKVCLADAREVGACEYGIRSWCDANNIDMSRRCILASEAVAAYRNRPQPEARAAILYARRHAMAAA